MNLFNFSADFLTGAFWTLVIAKTIPLFIMIDPIGNTGILSALLKPYSFEAQNRILKRECFIALFLMFFFFAFGAVFLNALGVSQSAVEITGGIILVIFAMNLLFPHSTAIKVSTPGRDEPFIVPIAIPLIAGPSCLATIILYSHETAKQTIGITAVVLAWAFSASIIMMAPKINRVAGKTGIRVLEQIMGLICGLLAVRLFLKGVTTYMKQF